MVNKCERCKKPFQATRKIDKFCVECRGVHELELERERGKRRREKLRKIPEWKKERICEECGKPYTPVQENQIICGGPACKIKRTAKLAQIRHAKQRIPGFECPVCGAWVNPKKKGIRTCGDEKCVVAWRNKAAREYGQGVRSGLITPKGGMNAFGEYNMPCPFEEMRTGTGEIETWGRAEMNPFS